MQLVQIDSANGYSTKNINNLIKNLEENHMQKNTNKQYEDIAQQQKSELINIDNNQEDRSELIQKQQKQSCIQKHLKFTLFISFIVILVIIFTIVLTNNQHQTPIQINDNKNDQKAQDPFNTDPYQFVLLNTTSALCLDGSPGGYYISKGGDPSKVLLNFQGGAWCGDVNYQQTLQNCYQRSKGFLGSSPMFPHQWEWKMGTNSLNQQNYFKDWKKVYLSYCDGSGHQGTRKDPIPYKDTLLYFRGHNITVQQLDSVQEKIGLFSKAQKIVVSGGSAGAVASVMWANYINEKAQKAQVFNLAGSGIFYDTINYDTNTHLMRQWFTNILNITNKEIDLPSIQCQKQFPNEKQKCMFVQNLHKHVKVPLFVVESLYDSYSIPNVLGVNCNIYGHSRPPLQNCTFEQRQKIQQYRENVESVLQEIIKNPSNGVWAIACTAHDYLIRDKIFNQNFAVPEKSANIVIQVIKNWIQKISSNNVYIDNGVVWPNNKACSHDPF